MAQTHGHPTLTGGHRAVARHNPSSDDLLDLGVDEIAHYGENSLQIGERLTVMLRDLLDAAGVAFFGFLAMLPALGAIVSILGLVTSPSNAATRAEDLFGGLPQSAEDLLSEQLDSLAQQSSSNLTIALLVSLALALWSASPPAGVAGYRWPGWV